MTGAVPGDAVPGAAAARVPGPVWLATVAGRSVSAAKEVLLALIFGTSPWKDALVVAWAAPTLLATYCNETLPALLVPFWTAGADARARRLAVAALAALAGLSLGVELWPRAAILALAPAFSGARLAVAAHLERWLAAAILLLGAQAMLSARLNALRRFVWPPLGAALPAAGALAALALTRGGAEAGRVVGVAAGLTIGAVAAVAMLGAANLRARGAHAAAVRAERDAVRPVLALLAAMAVLNSIPWAEQAAASLLAPGAVAAFDYGERLMLFVFGLSVAPFTAVAFTHLSAAEPAAYGARCESALRRLLLLTTPAAVGLAVFGRLITRCVYGWGAFNAASVAAVSPVVAILGAGLVLDALVYFLLFALYARGRAETKLPLALVLAGINVPLAFAGAAVAGVVGIAWAHVAGYAAALGWLAGQRGRLLPGVGWRGPLRAGGQAAAVSLAAALAVRAALPAAVRAGALDAVRSWAWAAAALTASAGLALLAARASCPGLLREAGA